MRYYAPLDPNCIEVANFLYGLHSDPMTAAIGAPVDDIVEGFEAKHKVHCDRCREYGVANIEVI